MRTVKQKSRNKEAAGAANQQLIARSRLKLFLFFFFLLGENYDKASNQTPRWLNRKSLRGTVWTTAASRMKSQFSLWNAKLHRFVDREDEKTTRLSIFGPLLHQDQRRSALSGLKFYSMCSPPFHSGPHGSHDTSARPLSMWNEWDFNSKPRLSRTGGTRTDRSANVYLTWFETQHETGTLFMELVIRERPAHSPNNSGIGRFCRRPPQNCAISTSTGPLAPTPPASISWAFGHAQESHGIWFLAF